MERNVFVLGTSVAEMQAEELALREELALGEELALREGLCGSAMLCMHRPTCAAALLSGHQVRWVFIQIYFCNKKENKLRLGSAEAILRSTVSCSGRALLRGRRSPELKHGWDGSLEQEHMREHA